MQLRILQADLTDPLHAAAIVDVLDTYASDPVGGGLPLSADVRQRLVPALHAHPTTLVLLAYADEQAVGVAVCFVGFSTFQARPLMNIHDLAVVPAQRGTGIGRALLSAVEEQARRRGCCKLTLEVLDSNHRARHVYEQFGFSDPVLGATAPTWFLGKVLD